MDMKRRMFIILLKKGEIVRLENEKGMNCF